MVRINKILYPVLFLSLLGCKNFQEQGLDDAHQIALEEPAEFGVPGNKYNKGKLFDFAGAINKWWVANDKLNIQRVGDTLKISLRECGQKYECWGTELEELLDLSEASVLKVTARSEGSTIPMVGISLKDMDGYDTNLDRPSQRVRKSATMEEYYFNYTNKWKQSWPDKRDVNPKAIAEILFFVNPGQANWTGTLYIDDIEIITPAEMPSEEEIKRRRREARAKAQGQAPSESTAPKPEQKSTEEPKSEQPAEPVNKSVESKPVDAQKSQAKSLSAGIATIDNFDGEISGWWKSSEEKIKLGTENGKLIANLDQVGPGIESFGKSFSKIDFEKTPVVKVRFKAEGNEVGDLRVDIKDVDGFSTNSKPNIKLFEIGTDFVDFYYDFTGKFDQTYPNVQRVNPSSIIEVIFFVNPGGSAFTGKLIIDEVSAISLDEFKKVK